MTGRTDIRATTALPAILRRLARDRAGNTLPIVAAAVVPIMALLGGGIDMGRSYLTETRLQQACDAGVLAARKKLGSQFVAAGELPDDVETIGNRFFNVNFRAGAYGSDNRQFTMDLESDNSVSGVASAEVPTSIMRIFGYARVPVEVACEATLNFTNTDIMMVLDTTGSMNSTNPSDTSPRIDVLRDTVKAFHANVTSSAASGTRIRFGFVPYATNINVGGLLKSDWMVDSWTYQSRRPKFLGENTWNFYNVNHEVLGGLTSTITPFPSSTCPADTNTTDYTPSVEISSTPHSYFFISTTNGNDYWCTGNDGAWTVGGTAYDNYRVKQTWTYSHAQSVKDYTYEYMPITHDVTKFKDADGNAPPHPDWISAEIFKPDWNGNPVPYSAWYAGCIEERSTYEIDDWDNVDFSRALDLDLDRVPETGDPDTQWRPALKDIIAARAMGWDGTTGTFSVDPVEFYWDYLAPGWAGFAACPSEARKLAEMSSSDVASYVDNLLVAGETYHDIGMIWGGRLISPTGLFADENADTGGKPTARHLIFLTDGQTQPLDISYSSYGVEPLDRRRWNPDSPAGGLTLREVVEGRFSVACKEVKKRNVTVWVIGFGTEMTDLFKQCAGPGHWFQADDAAQLNNAFESIAKSMGDLRISR